MAVVAAGAVEYDSVTLNCGSVPLAFVGTPQRRSHAAVLGDAMPGICTAIPNNPVDWPPTGVTEFSSLKAAVSGGGSIGNIDNPSAEFYEFTFTVNAGAVSGPQELTAYKQDAAFDFCVYSPDLVKTKVDCGETTREAGTVLQCVVTSMDLQGAALYISKTLAKPNVDVDGKVVDWNPFERDFIQLETSFEFEITMSTAGTYTVGLNGDSIKVIAVAPPDYTTLVQCAKYYIDVSGGDQVVCEIRPQSAGQVILAEPNTVYPNAPGLTIIKLGEWTIAQNYFQFGLSSTRKSGLFTVVIGNNLRSFDITVLAEPSTTASTCICDAGEIYIGSSVVCTSTAKDAFMHPVNINIGRYFPVSTSDRTGVASGFSAGYVYPITPRVDGEVTVGKEFKFRFKAEDRGFEERPGDVAFENQAAAKTECIRDNGAYLCSTADLTNVMTSKYITMSTGYGFASDDSTKVYRINMATNKIESKGASGVASAFCCAAAGSLAGKEITIFDGVISKGRPVLKVQSAGNVNQTVTSDSTLSCTSPVHKGETFTCTFTAKIAGGFNVAILADRVAVNGQALSGEEGNVRKVFVFPLTVNVVGTSKVTVSVTNPVSSKVLSVVTSVDVLESLAPTSFPTKSPTTAPTAAPTTEPTSFPTRIPTKEPTPPTSMSPTKEGETGKPSPSLRPPSPAPTAPKTDSPTSGGGGGNDEGGSSSSNTATIVIVVVVVLILVALGGFWMYKRYQRSSGLELQPYDLEHDNQAEGNYHPPI